MHATLSPTLLLAMIYYMDRMSSLHHTFTVNSLTAHRFLITAAAVASKGLSDRFWPNEHYANVGGVRLSEMSRLEREFLRRLDWKIVPQPEILSSYYHGLVLRSEKYTLDCACIVRIQLDMSISGGHLSDMTLPGGTAGKALTEGTEMASLSR